MPRSLTRSEFEQAMHANADLVADARVSALMAAPLPPLLVTAADLQPASDTQMEMSTARLRAYLGLVAAELLAAFDAALLDVVYAEDDTQT